MENIGIKFAAQKNQSAGGRRRRRLTKGGGGAIYHFPITVGTAIVNRLADLLCSTDLFRALWGMFLETRGSLRRQ